VRVLPEAEEEEAHLRALLRPPPIDGVENWGIPPPPDEPCDPALVAKLAQFHGLKRQGKHFNDTLMANKSFRNPHIYEKLVEFVEVDEKATNYPTEMWNPFDVRPEWKPDVIAEQQKRLSEQREASQARGLRQRIDFGPAAAAEKPRHRERDGQGRYEPAPRRGRERDDGKRSRWDVGAADIRGKKADGARRENGGR